MATDPESISDAVLQLQGEISTSCSSRSIIRVEPHNVDVNKTTDDLQLEVQHSDDIARKPANAVNTSCDINDTNDDDDKQHDKPHVGHVHIQTNGKYTVPDPKILQQLDTETQLQALNRIQYHLLYSPLFWIRMCVIMLSIILIVLCISYAFGAMSSTELILIQPCAGYQLEDIWTHSASINSQTGTRDLCWRTTTISVDITAAYAENQYEYKFKTDTFAIFQCIIFSMLTLYSFCIFIYGTYLLITDILAIKQQRLYIKSTKFRDVSSNSTFMNRNLWKLIAIWNRWYIFRLILMQILEIMFQTFALLLYNGYNVWDTTKTDVYLAYKPQFIYLFVCFLSFHGICTGLLLALYAFKSHYFNGDLFKWLEFCVNEFADLFYIIYPFIVVFCDANNKFDDHNTSDTIWIVFGLLNNKDIFTFFYIVFPLLLLCTKTHFMTNSVARQMRNSSYDLWIFVTKVMRSSDQKKVDYLANTLGFVVATKTSTRRSEHTPDVAIVDDEIYDNRGNLKLNISKTNIKSRTCHYAIAAVSILFIAYSIALLLIVINHITSTKSYCNSARDTIETVSIYPELFAYDKCLYKVYPFSYNDISHNCECRVFQIDWNNVTIPGYLNESVTEITVINGALSRWRMLEKFETDTLTSFNSSKHLHSVAFEFASSHFVGAHMKLFSWGYINISRIADAISNWQQLLYFSVKSVDSLPLPESFSQLSKLKAFQIEDVPNYNAMDVLCHFTKIQVIEIRDGNISSIPQCMIYLNNLKRLTIQLNHGITSFPLELMNKTNLKQLDLWQNGITYDDLLSANSVHALNDSDDYDPFSYFIARTDLKVFLNSNQICYDYRKLDMGSTAFRTWVQQQDACPSHCPHTSDFNCPPAAFGNGQCDAVCKSKECFMDGGDCYQFCFTKTTCNYTQFLNDECDEECNNEECLWDNENCVNATSQIISDGFIPTRAPRTGTRSPGFTPRPGDHPRRP